MDPLTTPVPTLGRRRPGFEVRVAFGEVANADDATNPTVILVGDSVAAPARNVVYGYTPGVGDRVKVELIDGGVRLLTNVIEEA